MMLEFNTHADTAPIFDSHAHYDDAKFDDFRDNLLENLKPHGIGFVINNSVNCEDSAKKTLALAKKYDYIYAAIGIHPQEVDNNLLDLDLLTSLLSVPKVVAIGEIGLDYYWTKDNKELQKYYFEEQLALAKKLDLPVVVHDREAHEDTLLLLKKYRPKGVVHCFSGSCDMAAELIDLGMYIGVGGVVTFNNAKKLCDVVKIIPYDKFLLETDAPYLSPHPRRKEVCNSSYIVYTARKIAELRNSTEKDILYTAFNNAKKLFGII